MDGPQVLLPGDNLPTSTPTTTLGPGTYLHNAHLTASLLGTTTAAQPHSVTRPPTATKTLLPTVGAIVLARVIRITARQAIVNILAVADNNHAHTHQPENPLGYTLYPAAAGAEFQGLIRVQDIRATEKDKVKVVESFRPGDIVRAVVISLGDQRDYYLSTAGYLPEDFANTASVSVTGTKGRVDGNMLGVLLARSDGGNPMVPVSWKEMGDVVTGIKEARKVAKPD